MGVGVARCRGRRKVVVRCPARWSPRLVVCSVRTVCACLAVTGLAAMATAGTFNPDRSIGDTVPAWDELPGVDGSTHAWEEVADHDFVVVVFTCNSCPYAVDYEERMSGYIRGKRGVCCQSWHDDEDTLKRSDWGTYRQQVICKLDVALRCSVRVLIMALARLLTQFQ